MSYTNKYLPGIELQTPQEVAAYIAAHPGDERARWWKVVPAPGNALGLTTDDIPEGIVNLYYNPSRVSKEIADAVASLEIPEASDDLPQPLGAAAAGVAAEYSRGDHVHEMPTASDVGAATTSHLHAASDVTSGIFDAARIPALPYLPTSQKGAANGVAELDAGGRVPSGQLPSYVDDVLEYANFAALPATGETGKIYITQNDNKTWRWSGSAYVEISASLALGETPATAYRGDRGKTAYDHSQLTTGNPHGTTAADVGALAADNPNFIGNLYQGGDQRITPSGGGRFTDLALTTLAAGLDLPIVSDEAGVLRNKTAGEFRTIIAAAAADHNHFSKLDVSASTTIGSIDASAIKVTTTDVILTLSGGVDSQGWDIINPTASTGIAIPSGVTLWKSIGSDVGPTTIALGGGRPIRITRIDANTWVMLGSQ